MGPYNLGSWEDRSGLPYERLSTPRRKRPASSKKDVTRFSSCATSESKTACWAPRKRSRKVQMAYAASTPSRLDSASVKGSPRAHSLAPAGPTMLGRSCSSARAICSTGLATSVRRRATRPTMLGNSHFLASRRTDTKCSVSVSSQLSNDLQNDELERYGDLDATAAYFG